VNQQEVTALGYRDIRQRFFGESFADADRHMRELGSWTARVRGRTNFETIQEAARAVLAVDAANAKWIAL
jgi:hypothetical protein